MEQPQLCPNCFKEIASGIEDCPACGERIAALSERDYTAKLVHALDHPLADVRMRAIIALGLRGEAAAALAACALRHPADVIEGLEVVHSLHLMGGEPSATASLEQLACGHPARAVREAAVAAIGRHGGAPSSSSDKQPAG